MCRILQLREVVKARTKQCAILDKPFVDNCLRSKAICGTGLKNLAEEVQFQSQEKRPYDLSARSSSFIFLDPTTHAVSSAGTAPPIPIPQFPPYPPFLTFCP